MNPSATSPTGLDYTELLLLALSVGVAVVALILSMRANSTSRSAYLTALRQEWESLSEHWAVSLLLYRGSSDYYVDADLKQRARVRNLELESLSQAQDSAHATMSLDDWGNALRAESAHVRAVVRFFAYCTDLLLSGRIAPTDAYRIFGPEVARHGAAIRWMAGTGSFEDEGAPWPSEAWWIPTHDFHGEQEMILALVDMLWAETARWGDNEPHNLSSAAQVKSRGSGKVCRRRLYALAMKRTGRPLHAYRLSRRLRWAEFVPASSLMTDDALIDLVDEHLAQWGRIPLIKRWRGRRRVSRWKSSASPT
ncbi:MAG: hypothetical protein QM779_00560 [Propionicimonas sp.]|uniref:hypothetical protein n=1 Tax=Propionicimonas sp. TaxID=1955623 RepID=UPI003D145E98